MTTGAKTTSTDPCDTSSASYDPKNASKCSSIKAMNTAAAIFLALTVLMIIYTIFMGVTGKIWV